MCHEIFSCALNFYHALSGNVNCAIHIVHDKILQTASEPAEALVDAALRAGGKDNITVIVAGVD